MFLILILILHIGAAAADVSGGRVASFLRGRCMRKDRHVLRGIHVSSDGTRCPVALSDAMKSHNE
jgi:hypothetical protein